MWTFTGYVCEQWDRKSMLFQPLVPRPEVKPGTEGGTHAPSGDVVLQHFNLSGHPCNRFWNGWDWVKRLSALLGTAWGILFQGSNSILWKYFLNMCFRSKYCMVILFCYGFPVEFLIHFEFQRYLGKVGEVSTFIRVGWEAAPWNIPFCRGKGISPMQKAERSFCLVRGIAFLILILTNTVIILTAVCRTFQRGTRNRLYRQFLQHIFLLLFFCG